MANDHLKSPLMLQAQRIDATMLPSMFSPTYAQYVIQQGQDTQQVVQRANEAASAVYDEQQKNEEQDEKINDQETRLATAEETIVETEQRVEQVEQKVSRHEEQINGLEDDVDKLQEDVESIKDDYVSKSVKTEQSLSGPLNVSTSYSVGGVKVVGPRQTGWTESSGTAYTGEFNADSSYPAGEAYSQGEVSNISGALRMARQRIKALEDALRNHGLID